MSNKSGFSLQGIDSFFTLYLSKYHVYQLVTGNYPNTVLLGAYEYDVFKLVVNTNHIKKSDLVEFKNIEPIKVSQSNYLDFAITCNKPIKSDSVKGICGGAD